MNLQERFNEPIPEGYAIEIMKVVEGKEVGTGLYHIPIIRIKEMLSTKFIRWTTSNFIFQMIPHGNKLFINASVYLEVELYPTNQYNTCHTFNFVGATTYELGRFEENQNHSATALSECIKNASKNIGRTFGLYLNQGLENQLANFSQPIQVAPTKKKADPMKKAIDKLVK